MKITTLAQMLGQHNPMVAVYTSKLTAVRGVNDIDSQLFHPEQRASGSTLGISLQHGE